HAGRMAGCGGDLTNLVVFWSARLVADERGIAIPDRRPNEEKDAVLGHFTLQFAVRTDDGAATVIRDVRKVGSKLRRPFPPGIAAPVGGPRVVRRLAVLLCEKDRVRGAVDDGGGKGCVTPAVFPVRPGHLIVVGIAGRPPVA